MYCYHCGAEIANDAAFCHKCGAAVNPANPVTQREGHSEKPTDFQSEIAAETYHEASTTGIIQGENSVDDFKSFVDTHVQSTTSFSSAEELLSSHVRQIFLWICFGIPAIIGLVFLGPAGAVLIGLALGYPVYLVVDWVKSVKASRGMVEVNEGIDPEELIRFLNEYLCRLSPYFQEWYNGNVRYSGSGILAAGHASHLNDIEASLFRIETRFGQGKLSFVQVCIDHGGADPKSNSVKYSFYSPMKSVWPARYVCMVKAAPILEAAMEYYLKKYH